MRPADHGRVPSWLGLPSMMSSELCQAMMGVLLGHDDAEAEWLTRGAELELTALREGYDGVLEAGTAPLEDAGDGVQWHTFAGGAVNRLLAAGLAVQTGKKWIAGNLSVRCKDAALTEVRDAVRALPELDWDHVAADAAHNMAKGLVSKFQPCLPEAAEDRLLAERLLDLPATLRFLGSVKVSGRKLSGEPRGTRLEDTEILRLAHFELRARVGQDVATPRNPAHWVATPAGLRSLVPELAQELALGLDVETTLDFGTLCLVQIASKERTYLIDPFAVGSLAPLAAVLSQPVPVKIIHNARFERRVLASVGIELQGVHDTLEASRRIRGKDALGGHSLAMVCERELGLVLDKGAQTSNWSRRPLDAEQLRYAALDAEILLRVYEQLDGHGRGGDVERR